MNISPMLKIIVSIFLVPHSIVGINLEFIFGSWLGLYPTTAATPLSKFSHIPAMLNVANFKKRRPSGPVRKHELEDEYPERTTPESTQEIDETRPSFISCKSAVGLSIPYTTSATNTKKVNEGKGVKDYFLSIIRKHKPITITSTIIEIVPQYSTVYPSCLKFGHNVSRMCEGTLITIEPTPLAHNDIFHKNTTSTEISEIVDNQSNSASRFNLIPTRTRLIPSKTIYGSVLSQASDYDYEFGSLELFDDANNEGKVPTQVATPKLRSNTAHSMKENHQLRKVNNRASHDFLEYKYIINSEVISVTKTMTTTNNAVTATVIVSNCLPRDIQIPLCSSEPGPFSKIPSFPMVIYP